MTIHFSHMMRVLIILGALLLLPKPQALADNWTSANGNSYQTRASSETISPPLAKRWNIYPYGGGKLPPAIENHTVYVSSETIPSKISAIDLATGRVKWEYRMEEEATYYGVQHAYSSPAVKNGIIYVGSKTRLYAIRDRGDKPEVLWHVPMRVSYVSPVVTDAALYVSEGGDLYAIDPKTGKKKWGNTAALSSKSVVVAEGKIFGTIGSRLFAYQDRGSTYSVLWSKTLPGGGDFTQVAYHNGNLFVGLRNEMYCFHAKTGNLVWKAVLPADVVQAPVVGIQAVYLNTADKSTIALDLKTGQVKWRAHVSAEGAPLLAGNVLYTPSGVKVKALHAATGKLIEEIPVVADRGFRGMSLAAAQGFLVCSAEGYELVGLLPKEKNIHIEIEGNRLDGRTPSYDRVPVILQGRTLAPMRAVFESLGATVYWEQATQTITAVKGDRTVKMTIGSTTAWVGNKQVSLDVAPQLFAGRTMVPLRFVSESLDTTVIWNAETKTVSIWLYKEFEPQKLVMNGQEIPGGIRLYLYANRLLGDAKPLFEHLGGKIEVRNPIGTAYVTLGENKLVFDHTGRVQVGERTILIHPPMFLGSDPLSDDGHFYLDLAFFSTAYGWKIEWDRDRDTLFITK